MNAQSTVPGISISDESIDFGDCWNRYNYTKTFKLINENGECYPRVVPTATVAIPMAVY